MYQRVMDEVIEACQVPFEEDGVNSQTLEDLRIVSLCLFASVFFETASCERRYRFQMSFYSKRDDSHPLPWVFFFLQFFIPFPVVEVVADTIVDVALIGRIFPPNFAWGNLGILEGASRDFTRF